MFHTKGIEKIISYILYSITYFEKFRRSRDKVENIVEPDRPQMKICRKRIACWVHKATNKHSEYVILLGFTLQQWLHECTSLLLYTYIACLLIK